MVGLECSVRFLRGDDGRRYLTGEDFWDSAGATLGCLKSGFQQGVQRGIRLLLSVCPDGVRAMRRKRRFWRRRAVDGEPGVRSAGRSWGFALIAGRLRLDAVNGQERAADALKDAGFFSH